MDSHVECVFSPCRKWRYTLPRMWKYFKSTPYKTIMFIGLNPSTADEVKDDPTVRRCIQYAKDWGYDGMYMMNIFAWRDTDPKGMKLQEDPIGVDNDNWLKTISERCEQVVFAWGTHGSHKLRATDVIKMFPNAYCLGKNKDGSPKHPLYLKKNLKLIKYNENI